MRAGLIAAGLLVPVGQQRHLRSSRAWPIDERGIAIAARIWRYERQQVGNVIAAGDPRVAAALSDIIARQQNEAT
jgi:hypothetical protein